MFVCRIPIYLVLALALSGLGFADQLTLKNGDRVTGKIVKKDGDKVTVKTDLMGDVTIAWDAVTAISSDQPLTVVLPNGKSVAGKISSADGKMEVATQAAVETAPLPQVSAIRNADEQKAHERMLHPKLLELWAGYFDLGLAAVRGNAKTTTFTTAFNAVRATRNDKITLYYNQIYATATIDQKGSATAEAVRGGWAYNRNVSPRLFLNTFNDYEYDRFQNLDLRFVAGGGFGFSAYKKENTQLDVLAGADYDRESFNTPLTRNSVEAYWGDDFTHKLSAKTSLRQSFRMFNNLSDSGVYRMNFDLAANTTFRKWLAWQITASDRFLSDPVVGRQRNDILLSTGFRVSFAR
jgi:small nuclear ribonucleoprotein (snRNP)-like protein